MELIGNQRLQSETIIFTFYEGNLDDDVYDTFIVVVDSNHENNYGGIKEDKKDSGGLNLGNEQRIGEWTPKPSLFFCKK